MLDKLLFERGSSHKTNGTIQRCKLAPSNTVFTRCRQLVWGDIHVFKKCNIELFPFFYLFFCVVIALEKVHRTDIRRCFLFVQADGELALSHAHKIASSSI